MPNGIWEFDIFDSDNGLSLEGPLDVTVTREDNGSNATLFEDVDGNTGKSNPFTTTDGKIKFYADQRIRYKVAIVDQDTNTREFEDQSVSKVVIQDTVESVSTLRSASFPSNIERLYLSGYYGVGTPGGGELFESSGTDDGGIKFEDNDGRIWERNLYGYPVLSSHFGIKDDGSDYTAELQSLVDLGGHVKIVGSGDYICNGITVDVDGTRLEFERGAVLKSPDGTPGIPIEVTANNVRIDFPELDGNKANTSNQRELIKVSGDDCIINNPVGRNGTRHVVFVDEADRCTVYDCESIDCDRIGVKFQNTLYSAAYNTYASNGLYAGELSEGSVGCLFYNTTAVGCNVGVNIIVHSGFTDPVDGCVVDGIYCENTGAYINTNNPDMIQCPNLTIRNLRAGSWDGTSTELIHLQYCNYAHLEDIDLQNNGVSVPLCLIEDSTGVRINRPFADSDPDYELFEFVNCNDWKVTNGRIEHSGADRSPFRVTVNDGNTYNYGTVESCHFIIQSGRPLFQINESSGTIGRPIKVSNCTSLDNDNLTVSGGNDNLIDIIGMPENGRLLEFSDGDTTPDVTGNNVFLTDNSGATTITDFDGEVQAKEITILVGDNNTTFNFTSGQLIGNNDADFAANLGDVVKCTYRADTDSWYCDAINAS